MSVIPVSALPIDITEIIPLPNSKHMSIIGIAGSSGSGKSTVAQSLVRTLNDPQVAILSMDSFYKPLTPAQSEIAFRNEYDFDSPEAIDFDVLVESLHALKSGQAAEIPVYSFSLHQRLKETVTVKPPHVLILEGIFALYDPRVLELLEMKVFCEADADMCLSRRILRDVKERDRDIEGCIKQWFAFVKPNYEKIQYVEPQRKEADIIVPRGIQNQVAMNMIVHHIDRRLLQKLEHQKQEEADRNAAETAP